LFWDFIHMNEQSMDIPQRTLSLVLVSRRRSPTFHGGLASSGAGTADPSAGRQ